MDIVTDPSVQEHQSARLYWVRYSDGSEHTQEITPALTWADSARWMKREKTPHFMARKRRGELLPYTAFEQYQSSLVYSGETTVLGSDGAFFIDGAPVAYGISDFVGAYQSMSVPGYLQSLIDQSGLDRLVQSAAAKIESSGYDALTGMGEFQETVRMFLNAKQSLLRLIKLILRKKDWQVHHLQKAMGLWLEGRYGWRAFVFDMSQLYTAVTAFDKARSRWTERVGLSQEHVKTWASPVYTGWVPVHHQHLMTVRYKVGLRGSVTADISPAQFQANPITAGWELLTLSFVVDWFVNVGQALQAMSFMVHQGGYTAAKGVSCRVDSVDCTTDIIKLGTTPFGGPVTSASMTSQLDVHTEYVQRIPCNISLTPHLSLNLDAFKITDLYALWLQAKSRR